MSVALGVLLLAGIVASKLLGNTGQMGASTEPASAASPLTAAAVSGPTGRLDFETGSERLPVNSIDVLGQVADLARATSGSTVEIIAYYPAGNESAKDLATRRAAVARHGVEADGVPRARLRSGVAAAAAGDTGRAAARVEFWVR
ncbi:MAG: hypothetical protein ABI156_13915 [Caldimonas sp.]